MHGTVGTFGKDTNTHIIFQYLDGDSYSLLYCRYRPDTVPDAVDGDHLEEGEKFTEHRLLENVRSGDEYFSIPIGSQYQKRIHKCIAMIGSKNDRSISRDSIRIEENNLLVGSLDKRINRVSEESVQAILVVNLSMFL